MIPVKAGFGQVTHTGSSSFDAEHRSLASAGTTASALSLATVVSTVDVHLSQLFHPRVLREGAAELSQHPPRHFVADAQLHHERVRRDADLEEPYRQKPLGQGRPGLDEYCPADIREVMVATPTSILDFASLT